MADFAKALALLLQGGNQAQQEQEEQNKWLVQTLGLTPEVRKATPVQGTPQGEVLQGQMANPIATMNIGGKQTPFFMPGKSQKDMLAEKYTQGQIDTNALNQKVLEQSLKTGEWEQKIKERAYKKQLGEIIDKQDLRDNLEDNTKFFMQEFGRPVLEYWKTYGKFPEGYKSLDDVYKKIGIMAANETAKTYVQGLSPALVQQRGGVDALMSEIRNELVLDSKARLDDENDNSVTPLPTDPMQLLKDKSEKSIFKRTAEGAENTIMDLGSSNLLQNIAGLPGQIAQYNPLNMLVEGGKDLLGIPSREESDMKSFKRDLGLLGYNPEATLTYNDSYIDPMYLYGKLTANNKMMYEAQERAVSAYENLKNEVVGNKEGQDLIQEIEDGGGLPILKINKLLKKLKEKPSLRKGKTAGAQNGLFVR